MFTGRRYDPETGTYYYRARYYDPELRRFLEPDLIGYVDGMNLYAYVGNSPVNFVDPSGKIILIDDLIAFAGIKAAKVLVKSVSYVFGKPLSAEQSAQMDAALVSTWKKTTVATPAVVGGVVAGLTKDKVAGLWAYWGAATILGGLAGDPSHEIGMPPIDIPGIGQAIDVLDAVDIFNATPVGDATINDQIFNDQTSIPDTAEPEALSLPNK